MNRLDPILALKGQIACEIRALVGCYNQHLAADALGVDQPRMSDILRDRLERFSLEKLIRLLSNLDHRVELTLVNDGDPILRIFSLARRNRLVSRGRATNSTPTSRVVGLGCELEFKRAIELNSNYGCAHDLFGMAPGFQGRVDDAIAEGRRSSVRGQAGLG